MKIAQRTGCYVHTEIVAVQAVASWEVKLSWAFWFQKPAPPMIACERACYFPRDTPRPKAICLQSACHVGFHSSSCLYTAPKRTTNAMVSPPCLIGDLSSLVTGRKILCDLPSSSSPPAGRSIALSVNSHASTRRPGRTRSRRHVMLREARILVGQHCVPDKLSHQDAHIVH